ncbi:hypothetical protein [Mucilaginibacter flavidus]|uniref:hypothetical protein n=1 Tax=Mucilaginibacter flavidus TaxID=2949309 RepID=UPI0020928F68|nr:hypothetical protein [Mucilaginibacter flavidus]MCO5949836.1 hypothetical protein [Mucilaginibacter flavidus]
MNLLKKRAVFSTIGCLLFMNCLSVGSNKVSYQTPDIFAALKEYKQVKSLKGKAGELLGYIYVKENKKYTNGVLSGLLVVKKNGVKLDTLYRIDSKGLFNSKGKLELKNEPKGYYEFKLGKKPTANEDWFTIEFVDSKGKSFSDDNNYLIDWDAKNKAFGYEAAP